MDFFKKRVLVLNSSWMPINIKTVYKCINDVLNSRALIADHTYTTYDFMEWIEYSNEIFEHDNTLLHFRLNLENVFIIPEIIKMETRFASSYRSPRLTKLNILRRDKFICQYCGKQGTKADMNVDHVVPKAQGGKTTWLNLVASCMICNHRKADRTPTEANLKLLNEPFKPQWDTVLNKMKNDEKLTDSWKPYIHKK